MICSRYRMAVTTLILATVVVGIGAHHAAFAQDLPVTSLELNELWRRGGDDDEIFFGNLDRIVTDPSGNAYALDTQLSEVRVFSPDGELLRTIGREGEGPGEFRGAGDLYYGIGDKVGVLQIFPGRIVQMDPEGNPLDNYLLPERPGGGFQVVLRAHADPDRLIVTGTRQDNSGDQQMQNQYLESYTADGELLATFHEESHPFRFGGMDYKESIFVGFQRRWTATPDGRVMAPLDYDAYKIHIWKADGSLERVVERADYPPLARTNAQMETTQKLFDAVVSFNPRSTFEVSKTFPAISQIFARPDGELWVLSSRGIYERPENTAALLDVFDREGVFTRQIALLGDINLEEDEMYILGDRVFVITDALGSAMNALGADSDDSLEDVEPSNLVCFELRTTP